jgi:hypothetical protein
MTVQVTMIAMTMTRYLLLKATVRQSTQNPMAARSQSPWRWMMTSSLLRRYRYRGAIAPGRR